MSKIDLDKLANQILCNRHIHANFMCRLRFVTVKAVAGIEYSPISAYYCPSCKYRCLQRAGVYERARDTWARYGIYIPEEAEVK